MQPTEINKLAITVINVLILGSLPGWLIWHIRQLKRFTHLSYDWWLQIIVSWSYIIAIAAEIPALWSRWKAYYEIKMFITDGLYILTTWDRFAHMLFYIVFMFLTWSITYKRVPQSLKDVLS